MQPKLLRRRQVNGDWGSRHALGALTQTLRTGDERAPNRWKPIRENWSPFRPMDEVNRFNPSLRRPKRHALRLDKPFEPRRKGQIRQAATEQ